MKKYALGFVAGLAMTLFIQSSLAAVSPRIVQETFTDVPQGIWYEMPLRNMLIHNFIKGYDDKTFRGGEAVKRAELVTVMDRIYSNNEEQLKNIRFLLCYGLGAPVESVKSPVDYNMTAEDKSKYEQLKKNYCAEAQGIMMTP